MGHSREVRQFESLTQLQWYLNTMFDNEEVLQYSVDNGKHYIITGKREEETDRRQGLRDEIIWYDTELSRIKEELAQADKEMNQRRALYLEATIKLYKEEKERVLKELRSDISKGVY